MSLYIGDEMVSIDTESDTVANIENRFLSEDVKYFINYEVTSLKDNKTPFTNVKVVKFPNCITIGRGAFYGLKTLEECYFSNCKTVRGGAFANCVNLNTISFPLCENIESTVFMSCSNLSVVSLPTCTKLGSSAFDGCSNLINAYIPQCSYLYNNAFNRCINLEEISLPKCTFIGEKTFANCTNLKSIYLSGSEIINLANINAFENTLITPDSGSIFVPPYLIEQYRASSNWSYYKDRIFTLT